LHRLVYEAQAVAVNCAVAAVLPRDPHSSVHALFCGSVDGGSLVMPEDRRGTK